MYLNIAEGFMTLLVAFFRYNGHFGPIDSTGKSQTLNPDARVQIVYDTMRGLSIEGPLINIWLNTTSHRESINVTNSNNEIVIVKLSDIVNAYNEAMALPIHNSVTVEPIHESGQRRWHKYKIEKGDEKGTDSFTYVKSFVVEKEVLYG